jgi:hypothetical protein
MLRDTRHEIVLISLKPPLKGWVKYLGDFVKGVEKCCAFVAELWESVWKPWVCDDDEILSSWGNGGGCPMGRSLVEIICSLINLDLRTCG